MKKRVSIKIINKNKTSKTLLNVFMLTFIMFVIGISTVYALSYTVSYNNNTGSGTMSDSTYTSNPGTLSTNTFTKSGYKFMGWNKNSGATSDWYRENNSINAEDGDAITLYAQWCKVSNGTIKISNTEVKDTYGNYVFRNNKYITIEADDKTITYGETPDFSYTINGTLQDEEGVTGTETYTVKNAGGNIIDPSTAAPGTYIIDLSGLSAASGYSIQATNTGTLTITAISTSVPTADDYCNDLTYNGSNQILVSEANEGFTWDTTTTTGKNATSYTVKANLTTGYKWSDNTTGQKTISCSIAKKEITVTADNKSIAYGASAPTYTYTVTGAISGETAVSGTATYTIKDPQLNVVSNVSTAYPDSYSINVDGLTAGSNYELSYAAGTLTITGITVTLDNNGKNSYMNGLTASDGWRIKQKSENFPEGSSAFNKANSYCCGTLTYDEDIGKSTITGVRYAATNLANKNCGKANGAASQVGESCTLTVATVFRVHDLFLEDDETVYYNEDKLSQDKAKKVYTSSSNTYGTIPTPTFNFHTFDGWYTQPSGGTQVTSTSTLAQSTNHTLYAHWTASAATISLYGNEGTITDSDWKSWRQKITSSTNVGINKTWYYCCSSTAPEFNITTGVYTVNGTTTTAASLGVGKYCAYASQYNTSGVSCTVSTSVCHKITSLASGSDSNYAYYNYDYYQREELDSCNNQIGCHRSLTGNYGVLPTPTRANFQFAGWYTAPSGGTLIQDYDDIVNSYLYAHWVGESNITANANGGSIPTTTGWTVTGETATRTIGVGETYAPLPTPTKSNSYFGGWYTALNGGKVIVEEDYPTGDRTIYAHWTESNERTANVRIENATVDSITKVANYNTSVSFTITPNAGTSYTSVTCTNGQTATVTTGSGTDTLTINNLTENTLCKVVYTELTYTITYHAGSETSASNIPAIQTKRYSKSINLSNMTPTSSSKTFIGWATVENATNTSGTWYDQGDLYSINQNLDLYAQWYDVKSLEQAYTTFVQSGSDELGSGGDFNIKDSSVAMSVAAGNASGKSISAPSVSGYTAKYLTAWGGSSVYRYYRAINGGITVRNMNTSASSTAVSYHYLQVKNRSATSYSDAIDTRIDRLQKIQDVALKYSEIKTKATTVDNKSVSSGVSAETEVTPDSNYYYIGLAGYNLANASTSGGNVSRAYVWSYGFNSYSTLGAKKIELTPDRSYSSVTPKIKITIYGIEVLRKSARTTTFSAGSSKGAARYSALVALNSAKSNYFTAANIKVSGKISGATSSPSAWGSGTASKTLSIPNGKILGVAGLGVANGTNGSGESFANIVKAYISGVNSTSGTFNMTFYAGNKSSGATAGNAMTKVYGYGYAIYVSTGSMTIS